MEVLNFVVHTAWYVKKPNKNLKSNFIINVESQDTILKVKIL